MKKTIVMLLAVFFISCNVYCSDTPTYYVIVNTDMSIHTIAKKTNDVLSEGQKRFPLYIDQLPEDYDNEYYYWGSDGLTVKEDDEVEEIKEERIEKVRKAKLKQVYSELKYIEEIADIDDGDWTEEIEELETIIKKHKKAKE